MKQELFLKQEELAQAHQLGELQKEYRVQVGKILAIVGTGFIFGALLALTEGLGTFLFSLSTVPLILLISAVMVAGLLYRYRQLQVYLYTYGLLYLNGDDSQVARWEQIKKVNHLYYLDPGDTTIVLNDRSKIILPVYISGLGELRSTLKCEMANYRSLS